MGRKILAVIVGWIAAVAIFMVFQMISTMAAPNYPSNAEHIPQEGLRDYIATLPPMVFAIVLIGYIVGAFAGGFITSKMGRRWSPGPTLAFIVGVLLTIGGLLNFFVMFPGQPLWFIAASLISFIPAALIGYCVAR
jgi:MFS family permease